MAQAPRSVGVGVIEIRPLDHIMERYGKDLRKLSGAKLKTVLSRALNYEGQKAYTKVKRDLRQQGSFTAAMMGRVKFMRSSKATLETRIRGVGKEMNIGFFGARQFKYGTRAKVWGQYQKYPHTFIVKRYAGMAYHRTGKARFPIEGVYGPSIAKEIVKDQAPTGYYASLPLIIDRVGKELAAVLRGF